MKKRYIVAIASVFNGRNTIYIKEAATPQDAVFDALEDAGWTVDRSKLLEDNLGSIEDIVSTPMQLGV